MPDRVCLEIPADATMLPVLRKSDIAVLQKDNPPFGGLNVTAPGKARRLLMSPGPIFEPEDVGVEFTPELRQQEERQRAQIAARR